MHMSAWSTPTLSLQKVLLGSMLQGGPTTLIKRFLTPLESPESVHNQLKYLPRIFPSQPKVLRVGNQQNANSTNRKAAAMKASSAKTGIGDGRRRRRIREGC